MIHTFIVYGYDLGGPGNWRFTGFGPGLPLRTPWYDETDPTHDFAERATAAILTDMRRQPLNREQRWQAEAVLPYLFDTAIDMSPPGWTREASAPPHLSFQVPAPAPATLDEPARARYVLVALDSVEDVDGDPDEDPAGTGWQTDWDSLLPAALTELGLDIGGLPDWFWYRTATTEL